MRLNQTNQTLETITAAAVEKDPMIEIALRQYESLPEDVWIKYSGFHHLGYDKMNIPVLKPSQISQLFASLAQPAEELPGNAIVYISMLIQESYRAGNNNFTIDTQDKKTERLGRYLIGVQDYRPECRLKLNIIGEAGDFLGADARNMDFNVKGNVGHDCGFGAKGCIFNINGNASYGCGIYSTHCTFNIQGDVGGNCGWNAEESRFIISGMVEKRFSSDTRDSRNCYFKTKDREIRTNHKGEWISI